MNEQNSTGSSDQSVPAKPPLSVVINPMPVTTSDVSTDRLFPQLLPTSELPHPMLTSITMSTKAPINSPAQNSTRVMSPTPAMMNVPVLASEVIPPAMLPATLLGAPQPVIPQTVGYQMYDRSAGPNMASMFIPSRRPQAVQT
jgi:hypothetical protein